MNHVCFICFSIFVFLCCFWCFEGLGTLKIVSSCPGASYLLSRIWFGVQKTTKKYKKVTKALKNKLRKSGPVNPRSHANFQKSVLFWLLDAFWGRKTQELDESFRNPFLDPKKDHFLIVLWLFDWTKRISARMFDIAFWYIVILH